MTQPNSFLLTRLHWFQSYDSIQLISIWTFKRIEFHFIFSIHFNYLALVFFPHIPYVLVAMTGLLILLVNVILL